MPDTVFHATRWHNATLRVAHILLCLFHRKTSRNTGLYSCEQWMVSLRVFVRVWYPLINTPVFFLCNLFSPNYRKVPVLLVSESACQHNVSSRKLAHYNAGRSTNPKVSRNTGLYSYQKSSGLRRIPLSDEDLSGVISRPFPSDILDFPIAYLSNYHFVRCLVLCLQCCTNAPSSESVTLAHDTTHTWAQYRRYGIRISSSSSAFFHGFLWRYPGFLHRLFVTPQLFLYRSLGFLGLYGGRRLSVALLLFAIVRVRSIQTLITMLRLHHVISSDIMWYHVISCDITWYHVIWRCHPIHERNTKNTIIRGFYVYQVGIIYLHSLDY